MSCQAYERLLAGGTVSWDEIVREHPMLGLITVPHLIKAGVVGVILGTDGDETGVRLRRCEPGEREAAPKTFAHRDQE